MCVLNIMANDVAKGVVTIVSQIAYTLFCKELIASNGSLLSLINLHVHVLLEVFFNSVKKPVEYLHHHYAYHQLY